jgi:hypothetical protein
VARPLELDDLIEHFTLRPGELELLRNKTGATRLGFALLITPLTWKGWFPRGRSDLSDNTVEFVAWRARAAVEAPSHLQRSVSECRVFHTLRERLRCKEIWVPGGHGNRCGDRAGVGTVMITSGVVSAPLLPHHRRVIPQTRRNPRLCRSPVSSLDWKGLLRCPEFMSVSSNPTSEEATTVILRQSS